MCRAGPIIKRFGGVASHLSFKYPVAVAFFLFCHCSQDGGVQETLCMIIDLEGFRVKDKFRPRELGYYM